MEAFIEYICHRALEGFPIQLQVHAVDERQPLGGVDRGAVLRARINRHADVEAASDATPDARHHRADRVFAHCPETGIRLDIEHHRAHTGHVADFDDAVCFRFDVPAFDNRPRVELQPVLFQHAHPFRHAGGVIDREIAIGVEFALPVFAVAGFDPHLADVGCPLFDRVRYVLNRFFGNRVAFPVPQCDLTIIRRRHIFAP